VAWDPAQYLKFEAERARPFHDLVARIAVESPQRVVDLGCGPGNATATLLDRWPGAVVHGVDSSPEMIATASGLADARLDFSVGDIETWQPDGPVDVIVSNAALQWVPAHVELLPRWMTGLTKGGALAFQVPSNVDGTAADVFRTLATRPRWAEYEPVAALVTLTWLAKSAPALGSPARACAARMRSRCSWCVASATSNDSEVSAAASCAASARFPLSISRSPVRLAIARIGITRMRPSLARIRASRSANRRRAGAAADFPRGGNPLRRAPPRAGMVALVRVLTSTTFRRNCAGALCSSVNRFPSRRRPTRPHATRHGRDFITSEAVNGSLTLVGIKGRIAKCPTSASHPVPTIGL